MWTEADVWACSQCRSINKIRADRCYRCHAPREVAGVKPTEMPLTGGATQPATTGTYRSSEGRAVAVTVATVLFILSAAVASWMVWSFGDLRAAGEGTTADRLLQQRLAFLIAAPVLGVAALVAYSAWISRVVDNLPALGAGYSRVSPTMAFIEPLLLGVNLYSLPARAGEVVRILEGAGRGQLLIALAWICVVVPVVIGAWVLRVGWITESGADLLRTIGATLLVTFAFQAVGLVLGLAVIWHIEGLCRTRSEESRPSRP
jgi:hypothetical protein